MDHARFTPCQTLCCASLLWLGPQPHHKPPAALTLMSLLPIPCRVSPWKACAMVEDSLKKTPRFCSLSQRVWRKFITLWPLSSCRTGWSCPVVVTLTQPLKLVPAAWGSLFLQSRPLDHTREITARLRVGRQGCAAGPAAPRRLTRGQRRRESSVTGEAGGRVRVRHILPSAHPSAAQRLQHVAGYMIQTRRFLLPCSSPAFCFLLPPAPGDRAPDGKSLFSRFPCRTRSLASAPALYCAAMAPCSCCPTLAHPTVAVGNNWRGRDEGMAGTDPRPSGTPLDSLCGTVPDPRRT